MRKAMQPATSHEDSYAQNSSIQDYSFQQFAKPHLCEAIQYLVSTTLPSAPTAVIQGNCRDDSAASVPVPHCITVADFGCSYGQNTLQCMQFALSTLIDCCTANEKDSISTEFQYFFCDFPSNDFNSLFRSLQDSIQSITNQSERQVPKIFAAGVPGSFYSRLLPSASLHLGICFNALHWLSQIPPGLTDHTSAAWNGGRSWIHKETSPKGVIDAYVRQSRDDLTAFLKLRAYELVSGGVFFLLAPAPHIDRLSTTLMGVSAKLLDMAWKDLLAEGIMTTKEVDMFNIPLYLFTQQELQCVVDDIPEFQVLHMETIPDTPVCGEVVGDLAQMQVQLWLGIVASVLKPTMEDYLGKPKSEKLFRTLKIIAHRELDTFNERFTQNLVIATLLRK